MPLALSLKYRQDYILMCVQIGMQVVSASIQTLKGMNSKELQTICQHASRFICLFIDFFLPLYKITYKHSYAGDDANRQYMRNKKKKIQTFEGEEKGETL